MKCIKTKIDFQKFISLFFNILDLDDCRNNSINFTSQSNSKQFHFLILFISKFIELYLKSLYLFRNLYQILAETHLELLFK